MGIIRRDVNYVVVMIEIRIEGHKADLGYVIARPEWGKGYATEEVQSVVKWAIEQPRIIRVWHCATAITNLTSAPCQGLNILNDYHWALSWQPLGRIPENSSNPGYMIS